MTKPFKILGKGGGGGELNNLIPLAIGIYCMAMHHIL